MQIIGKGRIGTSLKLLDNSIQLIDRNSYKLIQNDQITMIATRNDDLLNVLNNINIVASNLLFIQNGMLSPFLKEKKLDNSNRGLLYFAVSNLGDKPDIGDTSIFTGPHAPEIVDYLNSIGVSSKEVDNQTFKIVEMEKLIWICTFCLLSQVHDKSVGKLVNENKDEIQTLFKEFTDIALKKEIQISDEQLNGLIDYSLSIPDYKGSVKEFKWRNGWFFNEDKNLKFHTSLLKKIGII